MSIKGGVYIKDVYIRYYIRGCSIGVSIAGGSLLKDLSIIVRVYYKGCLY